MKAFTAHPGDLLISCSGATLGRVTEIPLDAEFGIINQALLKVRLNPDLITNGYFILLFRSLYFQKLIRGMAWGSAIPNMIGVSQLKKVSVPVPPLREQQRIVTKFRQLMNICDELEQTIKQNQTYTQQLLQIALKEALQPGS